MIKQMVSFFAVATLTIGVSQASVLWDQPWDGSSPSAVAQDFTDLPGYSTYEFDDFVVGAPGWNITQVTIYGVETGNSGLNQDVVLAFATSHDFSSIFYTVSGSQSGADLVFTLSQNLSPGTYWISAWVRRPYGGGGGQWYWRRTTSTSNGSEHYFHNPGGGFSLGSGPIPGSQVFNSAADLAFRIEGEVAPEPASMVALGTGLASLLTLRRRKQ